MKIGVISDQHFGARGDSLIFQSYFEKFYSEIFFPTLKKYDIKYILNLGDILDRRKFVNFNILNRVRMNFLHPLEDLGIQMDVILGNHDCSFKNTTRINSPQELLGGWNNIKIYNEPEEIKIGNRSILFMPWITQDNRDACLSMLNSSTADLLVGHFEISGFQMYAGTRCDSGLDRSVFSRFPMTLSGHFHHKSSENDIHYVGAPYEITFGDMNDPKGFHILDLDDLSLEFIQNPYQMFHRVIYDDRGKTLDLTLKALDPVSQFENTYVKVIVNNKNNPYYFDKFIDLLYSVSPAEIKVVEDFLYTSDSSDESNIAAEDTLTILGKHIDQIEYIDADKPKLKEMIKGLYLEALNGIDF